MEQLWESRNNDEIFSYVFIIALYPTKNMFYPILHVCVCVTTLSRKCTVTIMRVPRAMFAAQ